MSEASVVASALDSTLQRQARTVESYEQEIANLSAELMSLRTAVDFLQTAIASHGIYEREEAARIAADKNKEKQRKLDSEARLKEAKESGVMLFKNEAEENAWKKKVEADYEKQDRDEKKALEERIAQKGITDKEEYDSRILYLSSDQKKFDDSMALLESLKKKKK